MSLKLLSRIRHELKCRVEGFKSHEDGCCEFEIIFPNGYVVLVQQYPKCFREPVYYSLVILFNVPSQITRDIVGSLTCKDDELMTELGIISKFS